MYIEMSRILFKKIGSSLSSLRLSVLLVLSRHNFLRYSYAYSNDCYLLFINVVRC